MKIVESLLGFKQKKSTVLEHRNSMLKLILLYNIPALFILLLFYLCVKEPYMDEQFHYRQFRTFHAGNTKVYDPKLTTPPGLYYIQNFFAFIVGDSLLAMRGLNTFLFGNLFLLFTLRVYDFKDLNPNNISRSLNLILTPTMLFFHFMDYTDTASIALLTMMYYYSLVGSEYRLGAVSLLSVSIRQNNLIWIFYLIVLRILNDHKKQPPRSFLGNIFGVTRIIFTNKRALFKQFRVQILVIVIFFLYLHFYNEGRLLFGDHSHHQITFHPNQILYLSIFVVLNAPLTLGDYIGILNREINRLTLSRHSLAAYLLLLSLSIAVVDTFTQVHPFITDDNRHYLFYFYRYFFQHSIFRFLMCLIYPFCINFMHRLIVDSDVKMLTFILWIGSSMLYLATTQLVQFRYFAAPFIMFALEIQNKNLQIDVEGVHRKENRSNNHERMIWTTLIKVGVNLVVMGIFLGYEFNGEYGKGRFMW